MRPTARERDPKLSARETECERQRAREIRNCARERDPKLRARETECERQRARETECDRNCARDKPSVTESARERPKLRARETECVASLLSSEAPHTEQHPSNHPEHCSNGALATGLATIQNSLATR